LTQLIKPFHGKSCGTGWNFPYVLLKVDFLAVVKTVELHEQGRLDICSLREVVKRPLKTFTIFELFVKP